MIVRAVLIASMLAAATGANAVTGAETTYGVQTYALTADTLNDGFNYAGYNEQLQGGPFGVIASGYYGSQLISGTGLASATGAQSGVTATNPYLTTSNDTAGTTRTDHGATATAYASADLATGALRASASGSTYPAIGYTFDVGGRSAANYFDTITVSVPGATASTVTALRFTIRTDGTFGGAHGLPAESILAGLYVGQAGGTQGGYLGGYSMSNAGAPVMDHNTHSGWASSSITGNANDFVFTGVYDVVGVDPVVSIYGLLQASGASGFVDYAHTSQLGLVLPTGVTYTSASGVLLTSPAPEPASWILMLGGAALAGAALRRRRAPTIAID